MHPQSFMIHAAAVAAVLTAAASAGVWEDEFPITQDPVLQYRSYIATAPDDTLYVLWPDWTDWEDTKVTLTRSADYGDTWSDPVVLFDGVPYDNFDLLADEAGLHLLLVEFYEDEEAEYKQLYYTRSLDGGETFAAPVRVGERDNIESLKLFSGSGYLFIYARNYVQNLDFDYLYVSDDAGVTWTEKPLLPGQTVQNPDFAVKDGVIHMAFGGFLVSPDIKYAFSTDAGDGWSAPVPVSSGAGVHAQLPSIVVDDDGDIHVAWEDDREDYFNIWYSRSTDGGITWSDDVRVNDTYYGARNKLLADEEGLHIVWCQYHGDDGWPVSWGSGDYGIIWYKSSDDAGVTWSDEFRVSQNEDIPPIHLPDMGANHVKLAEYASGFAAMWQDKRDGNYDLYMRNSFPVSCPADITGDGVVDVLDLLEVLAQWGTAGPADITGDGIVDVLDLLEVLAAWGPC